MKLEIKRHWFSDRSSIGTLRIDGKPQCFTLEDCARARGVKIPLYTAIPEGLYRVIIDFSQRFQRRMPHILEVPGFDGIRFHPGNAPDQTAGCVILGYQRGKDIIWESQKAYDDFYTLFEQAIYLGEEVTLSIVNEQL